MFLCSLWCWKPEVRLWLSTLDDLTSEGRPYISTLSCPKASFGRLPTLADAKSELWGVAATAWDVFQDRTFLCAHVPGASSSCKNSSPIVLEPHPLDPIEVLCNIVTKGVKGSLCEFWKGTIQSIAQIKKLVCSWALVAHACNPSYSGGRDQEDRSQQFEASLGK
jgi:hypothetical protein